MKRPWLMALGSTFFILLASVGTWTAWEYFFQSKNYRAYNSFPHPKRVFSHNFSACVFTDRILTDQFPFSGGGRLNFTQIDRLNKSHPGRVLVVNLREDEGYYLGQKPISYYGMYYKNNQFHLNTQSKKKKQWLFSLRRWLGGLPSTLEELKKQPTLSEEDVLKNLDIDYIKFDLARKNFAVQWGFVDRAIELFESISPDTWVHFHCAGGRGRTTTLSMLYDIFRNGAHASTNQVVQHHHCLGGENIWDTKLRSEGTWTKPNLLGRKALIETFHQYMNSPDGYPNKKWAEWLQDHNLPLRFTLVSQE